MNTNVNADTDGHAQGSETASDTLLAQVAAYLERGDHASAERACLSVLVRNPDNAEAHFLLGSVQLGQNQVDAAIASYRGAIKIEPKLAEAHNNLGVALERQAQFDDAAASYCTAIALRPTYYDAHKNLGNAHFRAGRVADAIASYGAAIAIRGDVAETHFSLATALAKAGQWQEAADSYRRAVGIRPNYPEAYNNLGNVLIALKRIDEAAQAFRAAIAIRPDFADAGYNLGTALATLGRWNEAEQEYRAVIALRPDHPEAHNNLGQTYLSLGRPEDAIKMFLAAAALRAVFPAAYYGLATAYSRLARWDEAIAAYRQILALNANYAEVHNELGNALLALGRTEEAVASYRGAVALQRDLPQPYFNLGNALALLARWDEAAAAYEEALKRQPDFPGVHHNLGVVLVNLGRSTEAVAACRRALELGQESLEGYFNLGNALRDNGQSEEAIAAYRRALALRPDDIETLVALANTLLKNPPHVDEAFGLLRKAHALQPLRKRAASTGKAEFSVLLMSAPGFANTPTEYLIGRTNYDSYAATLMGGVDYDLDQMRACADVVVNLVSDADWGRQLLPQLAEIIDQLSRPTINHPNKVLNTSREIVAERLANIPRCHVPKTIRIQETPQTVAASAAMLDGFIFPLLVRMTGTHGGERFEKLDDAAAVVAFMKRMPDAEYYITQYAPYESADGYFRKYRFIFVDGEIFPYHLAISDQWKVHHFRTDMANQEWMRQQEEAFLRDPGTVFDTTHMDALRRIQATIGLDYFGIDCGLDRNGDIVVFEVNATMLVHGETSIFGYKQPYIARIKDAFDAMLANRAHGDAARQDNTGFFVNV